MACCGVEVFGVSSNVRGTGIVDVCGGFKCCTKALRGDWGGVEAEEDGLGGVYLWIKVGE